MQFYRRIDDTHHPRILALLEENTRRAADKAVEWQLEAEL
jgi:hypothetical protein